MSYNGKPHKRGNEQTIEGEERDRCTLRKMYELLSSRKPILIPSWMMPGTTAVATRIVRNNSSILRIYQVLMYMVLPAPVTPTALHLFCRLHSFDRFSIVCGGFFRGTRGFQFTTVSSTVVHRQFKYTATSGIFARQYRLRKYPSRKIDVSVGPNVQACQLSAMAPDGSTYTGVAEAR